MSPTYSGYEPPISPNDPDGLSPEAAEAVEGRPLQNPNLHVSENTTKIEARTNAVIAIGDPKPSDVIIGKPFSSVYIAAGLSNALENPAPRSESGQLLAAPVNFKTTAAFLYLSNAAKIDTYLGLDSKTAESVSAIGNVGEVACLAGHATAVRFSSGNGGITLTTDTTACNEHAVPSGGNSGIILCAGNDSKGLQPMVKGTYLMEALEELADHVASACGLTGVLSDSVNNIAMAGGKHTHRSLLQSLIGYIAYGDVNAIADGNCPPSPSYAAACKIASNMIVSNSTPNSGDMNMTIENWKKTYLLDGEKSITSRLNKVN